MNNRLILTGGTGFVGRCLQDELAKKNVFSEILVASRSEVELTVGSHYIWDLATGQIPDFRCDVIIHAATPASAKLNIDRPLEMFWANVRSMETVIRYAESLSTPPIVLFTSSGAVYGEMPSGHTRFYEDDRVAPSTVDIRSAYAQGKRSAEFLLSEASERGVCKGIIARLFAFSGVHLPLDRHFAIGNFVRDAVRNTPIVVHGDGTAIRSYLDGSDMARWLLRAIEVEQSPFPLHIGSPEGISIGALALLVADRSAVVLGRSPEVEVLGEEHPTDGVSRYVPDVSKTLAVLSTDIQVSLESSIDRMLIAASEHLGDF